MEKPGAGSRLMPPAAAARGAAGLRGCGCRGGRGSGGAAGREALLLLWLGLLLPLLLPLPLPLLLPLLLPLPLLLWLWLLHRAFSRGGGGSAEQQTCRIWPGHLGGSAAPPPPWEGKQPARKPETA